MFPNPSPTYPVLRLASETERNGPGGPAGLQNLCGVVAPRSVGSTPAPLRCRDFGLFKPIWQCCGHSYTTPGDATQLSEPVKVHTYQGDTWWWYQGEYYCGAADRSPDDVVALVHRLERSRASVLDRAHAELRGHQQARLRREPIPEAVRHEV